MNDAGSRTGFLMIRVSLERACLVSEVVTEDKNSLSKEPTTSPPQRYIQSTWYTAGEKSLFSTAFSFYLFNGRTVMLWLLVQVRFPWNVGRWLLEASMS